MIVESMDKHLISILGLYKLCSKRKHTMVRALLKFFSKLCAKLCSFFENNATFFKYAFQKNKKHKTISSCIYIVNAA